MFDSVNAPPNDEKLASKFNAEGIYHSGGQRERRGRRKRR